MRNSALSGSLKPTRINPRVSNRLYASSCSSIEAGATASQLDPSLLRKIGSATPDSRKRACTPSGVIDHPSLGIWQLEQLRPFMPSDLKKGFERSIVPVVLTVRSRPDAFSKTSCHDSGGAASLRLGPDNVSSAAAAPTHLIRNDHLISTSICVQRSD